MSAKALAIQEPQGAPPSDLDAEGVVLSAAVFGGHETVEKLREILRPAHFYADANRRIYEAILELDAEGKPFDIVGIAGLLRDRGKLAGVGGSPYLAQLVDATPAAANALIHAERVCDMARKRAAVALGRRLVVEGDGDVGETAEWLRGIAREIESIAASSAVRPQVARLDAAAIFAPLEPIRYVIEAIDLCAGAPAMWAGYGFSGKTTAAQAAALMIAAGLGKVWGCFAARGGSVLHIDYEQGSRLTRERYQRLAVPHLVGPADLAGRLELVTMPTLYLDQAGVESTVERLVDGRDLVIIDSLRAAAPSIDENSSEVRRPLDMLSRISERTGAAFVLIHHARKPSSAHVGGPKMAIRGSGALFDACGSVLIFEGDKGQATRISHEKARASGRLVDDFELQITDVPDGANPRAGLLVTAQGAAARADVAEEQARTARLVRSERLAEELRGLFAKTRELGGADDMAALLGRKAADVRVALRLLLQTGEVEATGTTRTRRHHWRGRE